MANDEWMDLHQAAEYLKISEPTLKRKANPNMTPKESLIRSSKPVRKLLFRKSDLDLWMKKHETKAS